MRPRKNPFDLPLTDSFFSYLQSRKTSDRFIFYGLLLTVVVSGLIYARTLDQSFITTVPTAGGTFVEGVVGAPRFVNPVLAITRADHDLVALTYSGLLKLSPEGNLINDLAQSITISEDGLVYNVILREDEYFHDGTKVTAQDVAFTIGLIQEPELKSPLRGNWSGVTVEVVGPSELNFVLEVPYAPFEENLTVGVLPKNIWDTLTNEELPFSQHNTEPIGSGPYQLKNIKRNQAGLISEYELTAANKSARTAKIDNLIIRFYSNETEIILALEKNEVDGTAALSEVAVSALATDEWNIIAQPLPRVFSLFFNQNRSPALRDPAVREALEVLIDRQAIVNLALYGYGTPTLSPIPPGFSNLGTTTVTSSTTDEATRLAKAKELLVAADWVEAEDGHWSKEIDDQETTLAITIRSANSEVFEATANYLEKTWSQAGVEVGIELFEPSDLVQSVIRPRDYQALLFGVEAGRALDLYPFWHSSQREDPGLNVALYANIVTDKLLQTIRTSQDEAVKNTSLKEFEIEIMKERPVISLFSPSALYVLSPEVRATTFAKLTRVSERFSNIAEWYTKESDVWPIFAD